MAENRTMAKEARVEGYFSAVQPEAWVAERERCHAQYINPASAARSWLVFIGDKRKHPGWIGLHDQRCRCNSERARVAGGYS